MRRRVPRYHTIAEQLRERIRDGELRPGAPLDNQRKLARTFGVTIMRARETVSAIRLGRREARELRCRAGVPAFESERISYSDTGVPVVFDRVFIPGDRFRITRELDYQQRELTDGPVRPSQRRTDAPQERDG
jgi:DNA-binding GntR family transcriptional regulator